MKHKHTVCRFASLILISTLALSGFAAPETLRWENRGQASNSLVGYALNVAVDGGVVVAVGTVCGTVSAATCDWFVRAHDSRTGATLWEDRLDTEGLFDRAQRVTIEGERVFVSGSVRSAVQGFDFVVRAYDLHHGWLLWQQRIHRGNSDTAETIDARNGRVVVGGGVQGISGTTDFAVFTFDARTGNELWENVSDPSGQTDLIFSLAIDRDRLFVAGLIRNFTSDTSLLVRAHDLRTGRVLWEKVIPRGDNSLNQSNLLAVSDDLLFVPSKIRNPAGDTDFSVRAYDTETGALKWRNQVSDPTSSGEALGVSVSGDRLFAMGIDGCIEDFFQCRFWVVRAYDAKTGRLRWQNRLAESPDGDAYPQTIVSQQGQVFVGGSLLNSEGTSYEWTLRAYDAGSGALAWEERIVPDHSLAFNGGVLSLTLQRNRLFASGLLGTDTGNDFTLRAYDIRRKGCDIESEKDSHSDCD